MVQAERPGSFDLSSPTERGNGFSNEAFRKVLGFFPTGVAVITAAMEDGEHIGATVSSFNSVSLDPPLILFSIARSAKGYAAWTSVRQFAVNLLAEGQDAISTRFARASTDKWANITPLGGRCTNAPLLPGTLASLECGVHAHHDGGDHLIIVGRVLSLASSESPDPCPLVFFGSRYRRLDPEKKIDVPMDADFGLHGW